MDIAVLGPLEVRDDSGRPVVVPPGLPTRLLQLLVLERDHVSSSRRIVEALWDEPPGTAPNLVHGYVSRLRRALGADRIETSDRGYRLVLHDGELDVDRFRADLAAGRLRAALGHWRGAAFPDVAALPWAVETTEALERTRVDTLERVLEAEAAAGQPGVVAELEALVAQHPFRERLWAALVRALYAGGRQAEALATYRQARARLVDELGIEPGPELRAAESAVLQQDPGLVAGGSAGSVPAVPAARIVGRERELAALAAALAAGRLVTVVGPGGAGKTTLALSRAGAETGPRWFVDLAPLLGTEEIPAAIAGVIGVRVTGVDPVSAVAGYLGERDVLLVLDNCEHLVDDVADVAARLLAECPGLSILATSREPLAIPGEEVVRLGGLGEAPAVELFTELAAGAGVSIDPSSPVVREVCDLLDGLPLALELAAAGLADMTLAELVSSVRGGGGEIPDRRGGARHRTLAAVVEWSLALLEPADRAGLSALTVFRSPFESAAADAVAAAATPGIARRLARRSLLARDTDVADRARFRVLETVRAQHAPPGPRVEEAYLAHQLTLAEQAAAGVRTHESPLWMTRVRASSADLRAAVALGFERDQGSACRLVAALYWPWFLSGSLEEIRDWSERALATGATDPRLSARLWWALSATRIAQGDLDGSQAAARKQVELARAADDRELEALGCSVLGMVAWARGEIGASRQRHEEAMRAADGSDAWVTALVWVLAARTDAWSGTAETLVEAERLALLAGEPMVVASCHDYAGSDAIARGEPGRAADLADRALAGYEAVGYQEGIASAHALAGAAAAVSGSWPAARVHFEEALDVCLRLRHRGGVATAWDGLGIVAANTGRPEDAAGLLARADAERRAIGAAIAPALAELRLAAVAGLS